MEIPEVATFKEDVCMMVIDDDKYGNRVPIQVGTLHIDDIIAKATPEEFTSLGKAWDRARISSYIGGKAVRVQEGTNFSLDQVKGDIKLTKDVIIKPFEVVRVQGISKIKKHQKWVHVMVEPKDSHSGVVLAIPSYSQLKPGSGKISVGLQNHYCRTITVKAKLTIASISAANAIQLALKLLGERVLEGEERENAT